MRAGPEESRVSGFVFGRPTLYRLKRFLIEVVIWRILLSGILRLDPRPMPDLSTIYAGRRILLAACGPGTVLTGPSVTDAAAVFAFDISPAFVASCARSHPDWQVYAGDVLRMPHRDRSVDVAVIYSVLHHIRDDAGTILAELARVSAGRIVVVEGVVPPAGLLRRLLLVWYRLVDGGHRYYTRDQILAAVEHAGLQVEAEGLHGPIQHMWLGVLRRRTAGR